MPIDRRLIVIPNTNPPPWILYAHAVLLRAVGQANQEMIAAWCAWAGGATFQFFPSDERLLSNFCIITDGESGIGVFEGTRTLTQLIGQIVGSALTTDDRIPASVSSFDRVYADAVTDIAKESVPVGLVNAPILITGHSLGGAIAHIFAARRVNGNFTNVRLLTYGQPRTGDLTLVTNGPLNYLRIVNKNDPVCGVPPRPINIAAMLRGTGPNPVRGSYAHGGSAHLITEDGLTPTTDQETGTDLGTMSISLGAGTEFADNVLQFHGINVYAMQLYGFAIADPQSPNLLPVLAISRTLQGEPIPFPNPATAPIVPQLPPEAAVMSPTFVPAPFPGHLPLQDLNLPVQLIEVPKTFVGSSNTASLFNGATSMAVMTKVTFFYRQLAQGWQETYYNNASTIAGVKPLAITLGNALMALRGENTAIVNYRISTINVPLSFPRLRIVRTFLPERSWAAGQFVANPALNPVENWSDFYQTCVLMRCMPSTVGISNKVIFMRGLPDSYDVQGGQLNGQLYQFFGIPRIRALQQALAPQTFQFGWLAQLRPQIVFQTPFVSITQNANGTISFVPSVPLATVPNSALGTASSIPLKISGVRVPGNLNGIVPCTVDINGLIYTTKKKIAIVPWDQSTGTMSYVPKEFVPFSGNFITAPRTGDPLSFGNIWAERIGERKTGKVFGFVPGRKPNRIRA